MADDFLATVATDAEAAIAAHDHFGIPAGLPATLTVEGGEPLVMLDATLERGVTRQGGNERKRKTSPQRTAAKLRECRVL